MQFFGKTKRGFFVSRANRFTVLCTLNGKVVKAYLPNPGRLHELLLPGVPVYLEEVSSLERRLPFTVVAVKRENQPIVLHTLRANRIARFLIEKGRVPGLEGAAVVKDEVTMGNSRFDFLLKRGEKDFYLEVKSCTLFSRTVAMFPDAVTARGKKHVEELVALSRRGIEGAVLFLVHSSNVQVFMPEYHTDLEFAKTLCQARRSIRIIPLSISWKEDLSLERKTKVLAVPWETVEREAKDRGAYLLILRLPRTKRLKCGKLGTILFRKGFYIYVGSARKSLSKRVQRHQRLTKKQFWHIDYLRASAEFFAALPIRTEDDVECELAGTVREFAECEIPRFGSSDCSCTSHLFWTKKNPLELQTFHKVLQFFRMDRLLKRAATLRS